MSKKDSVANVEAIERRLKWHDRRVSTDRRNVARLNLTSYDCRSRLPRRATDISGELVDGDIWWNKSVTQYE